MDVLAIVFAILWRGAASNNYIVFARAAHSYVLSKHAVSRQKIWNSLIYKLRETFGLYRLIDVGHTV
jgi:hypothetical protein